MEITAMQALITHLEMLNQRVSTVPVDSLIDTIKASYINLEKEQIIDASKHSYIAGYLDNQCKVDESMNFPEEYYNQTYKNDITRTNNNI